jgi:hypothetical protein
MVPINRKKISLYEEAKNGLSSLVWQTASVFVGFILMLLLTVGNPSSFAITITFISGIAFVAWREQNRITKSRNINSDNLLNKRTMLTRSQQLRNQQKRDEEALNTVLASVSESVKTSEDRDTRKAVGLSKSSAISASALKGGKTNLSANEIAAWALKGAVETNLSDDDYVNSNKKITIRLLCELEHLMSIDDSLSKDEKDDAFEHLKALNQIALKGQSTKQLISQVKTLES